MQSCGSQTVEDPEMECISHEKGWCFFLQAFVIYVCPSTQVTSAEMHTASCLCQRLLSNSPDSFLASLFFRWTYHRKEYIAPSVSWPVPIRPSHLDHPLPSERHRSAIMTVPTTDAQGLTQFKEPFTFDSVLGLLSKVPFSTPFLALLPALAVLYHKHTNPAVVLPTTHTDALALVRSLLFSQHRWLGYLWIFILIRTINRGLNRYVRNHKEWRRDPIDYTKDVVVITGGSQGIGKEIVQLLSHKKHASIAVLDMAPPAYVKAPAGAPEIVYFKTDVSNREQVGEVGAKIRAAFPGKKIGVLINCAGVASGNTILDVDLESAARLWRINTLANWITAKEFAPDLIARNHGHVVTVSSAGAYATLPSMSEYATSKAAALAFHECLAIEFRTRYNAPRVRTTLVAPTKVRTALGDGMEDHADPFFTPVLEPVQVAEKVVWSLDSGLSQHLLLPGFANLLPWIRALPDWFRRLLAILDNSDNTVTHKSMARALKNGYGSNWEGSDKELHERRLKLLAQQSAPK